MENMLSIYLYNILWIEKEIIMKKILTVILMFCAANVYATTKDTCPEINAPKMATSYPKIVAPGIFAFKYDLSKYTTPTQIDSSSNYAKLIEIKMGFQKESQSDSFYFDVADKNENGEYLIDTNNELAKNIYWKDSGVVMDLKNGGVCNKASGRGYFVSL